MSRTIFAITNSSLQEPLSQTVGTSREPLWESIVTTDQHDEFLQESELHTFLSRYASDINYRDIKSRYNLLTPRQDTLGLFLWMNVQLGRGTREELDWQLKEVGADESLNYAVQDWIDGYALPIEEVTLLMRNYLNQATSPDSTVTLNSFFLGLQLLVVQKKLNQIENKDQPFLEKLEESVDQNLNDIRQGRPLFERAEAYQKDTLLYGNVAEAAYRPNKRIDRILLWQDNDDPSEAFSAKRVNVLGHEAFHRWQDLQEQPMNQLEAELEAEIAGSLMQKLIFPDQKRLRFFTKSSDPVILHQVQIESEWDQAQWELVSQILEHPQDEGDFDLKWKQAEDSLRKKLLWFRFTLAAEKLGRFSDNERQRIFLWLKKDETALLNGANADWPEKRVLDHDDEAFLYLAFEREQLLEQGDMGSYQSFVEQILIPHVELSSFVDRNIIKCNGIPGIESSSNK